MIKFPNKKGLPNLYFHLGENSGVGYYRQYLISWVLRELGLANVMISDFRWGEGDHKEPSVEQLFEIANWADLMIVGRRDLPDFYAVWGGIKDFFNIPVIMDTDDNVHFVKPHNPGYAGYYPGSEAGYWNKYAMNKVFSAITVTTNDLKEFYSKYNPKIYILPNSLDMKEWDKHPKIKNKDGFRRIGFICSGAHSDGVALIKKPILEIMKKYIDVKFLIPKAFMGHFMDFPMGVKERIEPIGWIKLQEWQKKFKELGLDIGLAPLTDNMFNRSKSNLRWLEYSAAQIPSIVSPVSPYLCVEDGKTGLVAKERDDWYKAIDKLLQSPELCYNIGMGAYKEISKNFDIWKNAPKWLKVYQEIIKDYHDFFGKKKKFC